MSALLPQTRRGRRSAEAERIYQQQLADFCNKIIKIKSRGNLHKEVCYERNPNRL